MGSIRKIFRKRNENNDTKEVTKKKNQPSDSLDSHESSSSYAEKSTSIKWSSLYKKEDWWAVWIGLTIFALSLPSVLWFAHTWLGSCSKDLDGY